MLSGYLWGYFLISLILIGLLSSCSGTRPLTEEQYLYTGAQIIYKSRKDIKDFRNVNLEMREVLKPKPNSKFLGTRPLLCLHNMIGEPKKEKGIKYWFKYKLGQAPVLYEGKTGLNTDLILENRLRNRGYFNAEVAFAEVYKKKTVSLEYFISSRKPYYIESIEYPEGTSTIEKNISSLQENSLIKPNDIYNLSILLEERNRIDAKLKEIGYYYFEKDYLMYRADSIEGKNGVRLSLDLKKDIPAISTKPYKISKIYIHDNFSRQEYNPDTIHLEGFDYISTTSDLKPRILINSLSIQPNELYNRQDHLASNVSLMGLGMFRFANASFDPVDSMDQYLNSRIYLSRRLKRSLSSEMSMVSKTNNFVGPGLRLTYKIRNVLKGSETFSINLSGRFETQYSGEYAGNTAYEVMLDATLDIPRIIPNIGFSPSKRYIPITRFTLGGGIYNRQGLYRFNTGMASYQFNWRKSRYRSHELRLVEISLTNLADTTAEFSKYLNQNPSLLKSFEEQFIIGTSYTYTINNLNNPGSLPFYFSGGIDLSGNLMSFLMGLGSSGGPDPENPYTVFGQPYSQYVRIRSDFRYYFKLGENSTLASRVHIGAGLPYKNSTVMPYVKQFFVGGTNSVRAFIARSVGPGTYNLPDSIENTYVEQVGDILGEANLEYRFPIIGYLKGAAFLDAGNIWLMNEDTLRSGGKFNIDSFYKEFAVGSGFGLRIDANIVVVRLDMAFPLRKPWLPDGERWVIDEVDLFNNHWRRKNVIWNFSIGYPF